MKAGQTVFIIHRTQNVIEAVLGGEETAQGFYTRWGAGHIVTFDVMGSFGKTWPGRYAINNENIFSTKEAAQKEMFVRRLRYPQFYGRAAA